MFLTMFAQYETRTKESHVRASFSGVARDTDQAVETCVQISQESHPSGTDGDRERAVGSLAQVQASVRVDVPTAPHFFCSTDQGVQHVCASFHHDDAWICARQTTDRDLVSVIQERKKNRKKEECKSVTSVFFADLLFFLGLKY